MAALRTGIHPQRVSAIAALLALAAFGPVRAQDQAPVRTSLVGVGGYLGLGFQSGIFPVYAGSPDCGLFTAENVITGWVGAIYSRPSYFNGSIGLTARLGWEGAALLYTAPPDDIQRIADTVTHTLVEIDRRFQYEATTRAVMLDLFARYQTGRWSFEAGPRVGYRYQTRFRQTDNVIGPGNSSFADGERQHDMVLGTAFTPNRFALGLGALLSYALPIGGNRLLVPGLVFSGDILSIVREQQWHSITMGAGAALQFDASPKTPPASPPPPAVVETPTPRRLDVGLKIHGMDARKRIVGEAVINVRNVLYRQHAPLLPLVFFDAASSTIPERYVQLSSNATSRFSMMAVPEMSQIEINHSVLNIIGTRLRQEPSARLTLHGSVSDDESPALALERARAVRSYLAASWGIDRGRIEARVAEGPTAHVGQAGDDERAESRRVLITSNDPNITAPIASERIIRDYDPPALKLEPTIDAEAGVRDWSITIRQGSLVLARFTRGDEGGGLTWQLDERLDSTIGTLTAELRVEDSTGQVKTASDQIALRVNRGLRVEAGLRERSDETERLSYMLVAFDYASSALAADHRALLAELAAALRDSARVVVTGYTDRTGDDLTNIELSRQRAESAVESLRPQAAARGLGNIDVAVTGAGVDTVRFPNDLPEGRILSRSVSILVEQPAGG